VASAGKKQRLSAEESRERLIEAGIASLAEHGLSMGLDAVNLEQAVRDSNVPRSSAYAVWSIDEVYAPQELFQRQVLMRAVQGRRTTTDQLMAQVAEFLADPPAEMSHEELMRELIRVAATSNLENVINSASWQIVHAMRSIMQSAPPESRDQEILTWMQDNEEQLRVETIENLYKPMAAMFGLRPRPEFGEDAWHLGEIAMSAFSEGLVMRYSLRASDYFYGLSNPNVADDNENWSIYALMFEKVIDVFFEKDPDA